MCCVHLFGGGGGGSVSVCVCVVGMLCGYFEEKNSVLHFMQKLQLN